MINKCHVPGKGKRAQRNVPVCDQWSQECDDAFRRLKTALTTTPILGNPDYSTSFIVETDACDTGLGAVRSQMQDGKRRVIAYASRSLRGAKKNMDNYSAMKFELLALKWAITEQFRDYLLSAKFTVSTDNNPLTFLMTKSKLSTVEQRWTAALAPFNFDIKYRSGKLNVNADVLSRLNHHRQNIQVSNDLAEACMTTVIPPSIRVCALETTVQGFESSSTDTSDAETFPLTTPDREQSTYQDATGTFPSLPSRYIRELQEEDGVISRFLVYWQLNRLERKPSRTERETESKQVLRLLREWDQIREIDGLLYRHTVDRFRGKIDQLLLPTVLHSRVLDSLHDRLGHQGAERTEQLVRSRCYWIGLHDAVKQWVTQCERCTVAKLPHNRLHLPMGRIIAERPLKVVAMDFTLIEPSSDGRENVLVLTDVFTKFTVAVVTRDQKAESVPKLWFNNGSSDTEYH